MTKINDNVTDDDLREAGPGFAPATVRRYPEERNYTATIRIANLIAENRDLRAKLPAEDKARMLARRACEEMFPAPAWAWPRDEELPHFQAAHAAILACEKRGFVVP